MGLFNDKFGYMATGAADTPTVLATKKIGGGQISDGDAFECEFEVTGYGEAGHIGDVQVRLGGKNLLTEPVLLGANTQVALSLRVWRDSGTNGYVTATQRVVGIAGGNSFLLEFNNHVSGLSWGNGQDLELIGKCNQAGGVILQRGGIKR